MTIRSRPASPEYQENYDRIFRNTEQKRKREQAQQQSDHQQMELNWAEPDMQVTEDGE